jgi:hypothetical protein
MENAASPAVGSRISVGLLLGLLVSLTAAGLAAGYVFDATRAKFDVILPDVPVATEKMILEGIELQKVGTRKSSAFGCGLAGAIIVGVLGLTLGAASRSVTRIVVGTVIGVVFGASFGAAGGYCTQELSEYTISYAVDSTTAYFMISAAFWSAIGIAAGLTALVAGPRATPGFGRFTGPLLGAGMAAVLTPVVATIVFPLDYKGRIPPRTRPESLLVGAVGAAFVAIGTGFATRRRIQSEK